MPVDPFSHHELLDRVRLVCDLFQSHIADHAAVTDDLRSKVDAVGDQLEALYQLVGASGWED